MEKRPAISVIVPVYKAEKYLHRCVDTLLAQTFQDFEVLLIDDGSPDKSGEICDDYAKKDFRVRVFHKENGGVSSARQCGIDNAQGEYTIHTDPDDWVEPEMLETLYKKAKEDDADMVICDYYEYVDGCNQYINQCPSSLNHIMVLKDLFCFLHGSLCNKLIRKELFDRYDVKFPLGVNYSEDLYICIVLLQNPINVVYLSNAFYHYDRMINNNSITLHDRKDWYNKMKSFYPLLRKVLSENDFENEFVLYRSQMAYAAIIDYSISISLYMDNFGDLKNKIYKYSWENICVLISLYGFYPVAKLLIEVRHILGVIKRFIVNKYVK